MSDILTQARLVQREIFNPKSKRHVDSFKVFLKTGNWGAVQFFPEVPYIEVPMTVMVKYLRHTLGIQVETAAELAERMTTHNIKPFPASQTKQDQMAALVHSNELMNAGLESLKDPAE